MSNSENAAAVWSLCLQSRQGRKIIKISSSSTTQELYSEASNVLGAAVASLKFGFPPKLLTNNAETSISSLLQNQDRLQVELGVATATASSTSNKKKATKQSKSNTTTTTDASTINTDTPSTSRRTKSKRAAAKAATEAMPSIIKAQDELLRQQQQPKKRARTTNTAATAASKKKNTTTTTTTTPSTPKNFSAGPGRRLADGAAVGSTKATSRSRRNPASAIMNTNATKNNKSSDMSEALLGALNDSGKMGRVLRKGMKNAVQSSYETGRAFSRLAAIQSKKYEILQCVVETNTTNNNNINNNNIDATLLSITYQGSVDKTKHVDKVDRIPRDVLQAVIDGIYASNPEALRPENLALLSPRVLWGLVHLFPDASTIEDMYKRLFDTSTAAGGGGEQDENGDNPNTNSNNNNNGKDWSFLRRRAQQLSSKALENLRQEQEENDDDPNNGERALEAVAAVEHAMEHLQDYESTERKARQAQAALARLQPAASSTEAEWKLITPSEPDRDELNACIESAPPENGIRPTALITRMMKECRIHNWRELANVTDVDAVATKLKVSSERVTKWIDKAQEESVSEIIVEICDNDIQAVEVLTEGARTGTPKDLAAWRRIPEMLHQQAVSAVAAERGSDNNIGKFSVQQLDTWCGRAYRLLEKYEWLNWYATPVE